MYRIFQKSNPKFMSSISRFFVGLLMFSVGIYILLKSIHVSNSFSMAYRFGHGNVSIPARILFLGFILGVEMLFFNTKSLVGWIVTLLSVSFFDSRGDYKLACFTGKCRCFQLFKYTGFACRWRQVII